MKIAAKAKITNTYGSEQRSALCSLESPYREAVINGVVHRITAAKFQDITPGWYDLSGTIKTDGGIYRLLRPKVMAGPFPEDKYL